MRSSTRSPRYHPSIHSFTHSFKHSSILSATDPIIHPSTHPLIHPFIHLPFRQPAGASSPCKARCMNVSWSKYRETKKHKLSENSWEINNFCWNREVYKFCLNIGGNMQYASLAYGGMDAPASEPSSHSLTSAHPSIRHITPIHSPIHASIPILSAASLTPRIDCREGRKRRLAAVTGIEELRNENSVGGKLRVRQEPRGSISDSANRNASARLPPLKCLHEIE